MAMVLLAGTGFFARGAKDALTRHFGWDAVDVAVGDFELPTARYADGDAVLAFQQRALPRLRQLPGVTAVSFSYTLPYTGPMGPRPYAVDGRERPVPGREPRASFNGVTPEYFDVTAIPVRRGRTFTDADTASSPRVVIVNETMARALFPDTSPLGRRIAPAEGEEIRWAEIVGVVGDARAVGVYERPVPFQVYHPLAQEPWHFSTFAVRTGGAPTASVLASIRGAFTALDPDLPVRGLMPAATRIARSTSDLEMLTKLLGSFGVLGLFLAGLGVWGVVARGAAERTGEIGIRVVLGAQAGDVVRLTLGSGPRVALLGVAVGLLGAVGLSRVIASIMPAMEPNGALVLALTAAALVLTALGASYLPARRAASVDPAVALRSE